MSMGEGEPELIVTLIVLLCSISFYSTKACIFALASLACFSVLSKFSSNFLILSS